MARKLVHDRVDGLVIRPIRESDAQVMADAFAEICWKKPVEQFERYAREHRDSVRAVLVAWLDGKFAGYVTVVWESEYPHFRENNIPEIVDLNVLPKFQRRRIGTCLMKDAEELTYERSVHVGIAVAMDPDYGPAQRLYVNRGYVPDGRGLSYDRRPVRFGQVVTVDDKLCLHLIDSI